MICCSNEFDDEMIDTLINNANYLNREAESKPMEEFMCGDIWTFLQDTSGRVFRYWVYRRMFTPDEQAKKYIDQEFFEDSYCKMGIIKECIQLPDNDLLIGFMDMDEEGIIGEDGNRSISYYKLSEIRIEYCERDQLTGFDDK